MVAVSIIILNYKNKGLVFEQLKHFFKQMPSCVCEVIVVDNNSGDDIADMLKANYANVRFEAASHNRGYGAGNNVGIALATGKYILIANPDIVLSGALVQGLYDFMQSHDGIGIAGPKILNADGTLQYSCVRFPNASGSPSSRSVPSGRPMKR